MKLRHCATSVRLSEATNQPTNQQANEREAAPPSGRIVSPIIRNAALFSPFFLLIWISFAFNFMKDVPMLTPTCDAPTSTIDVSWTSSKRYNIIMSHLTSRCFSTMMWYDDDAGRRTKLCMKFQFEFRYCAITIKRALENNRHDEFPRDGKRASN